MSKTVFNIYLFCVWHIQLAERYWVERNYLAFLAGVLRRNSRR